MAGLASVLGLEPMFWAKHEGDVPCEPHGNAFGMRVPLAPPLSVRGLRASGPEEVQEYIKVPAWFGVNRVVGTYVDGVEHMPHFPPSSLVLVDLSKSGIELGLVYAITFADGRGDFRRAVYEDNRLILRAASRRRPDLDHVPSEKAVTIDGVCVGCFPCYDPRKRDFEVSAFRTKGLAIESW